MDTKEITDFEIAVSNLYKKYRAQLLETQKEVDNMVTDIINKIPKEKWPMMTVVTKIASGSGARLVLAASDLGNVPGIIMLNELGICLMPDGIWKYPVIREHDISEKRLAELKKLAEKRNLTLPHILEHPRLYHNGPLMMSTLPVVLDEDDIKKHLSNNWQSPYFTKRMLHIEEIYALLATIVHKVNMMLT